MIGWGGEAATMSSRCPECGDRYSEKRRGKKTTLPPDARTCFRKVQLANGGTIGRWYIHES